MRPFIGVTFLAAALSISLLGVPGCGLRYEPGVYYEPQPALVEVVHRTAGQPQQVPLTVLASVRGIRQAEPKAGIPKSVEVRLRLENHGPSQVEFDPGSLELTTGSLRAFPVPRVRPPTPIEVSSGQRAELTADFPLPAGLSQNSAELDHLRLRWRVSIAGASVPQTVLFARDRSDSYQHDGGNADW